MHQYISFNQFQSVYFLSAEVFYTFKEALAMEIKAQDVSTFIKSIDEESEDDTNESKKQKLSDENEEFEFIKAKPGFVF